jgi:diphthine synthase
MVLYLIGLGLCNEKDITVKGLEYIKQSDYIYLDFLSFQLIPYNL